MFGFPNGHTCQSDQNVPRKLKKLRDRTNFRSVFRTAQARIRQYHGIADDMDKERGQRRGKRDKVSALVELIWKDRSGNDCYAAAEALDISELGMRVEMKALLDARSYVTVRAPKLGIHGTASVRNCLRQGPERFWVGLEFTGRAQVAAGGTALMLGQVSVAPPNDFLSR